MLLGIARHADAEVGAVARVWFAVDELSPVHCRYLSYESVGVCVSVAVRDEACGAWHGVAAQCQHVLYAEEVHVDEGVLDVVARLSAADEVRHYLDAVFLLYGSRDTHGAGSAARHVLLDETVGAFGVFHLLAVAGDVDECGVERHEAVDGAEDAVKAVALQWRQQFEGEARLSRCLRLVYYVDYFHWLLLFSSYK